MNTKQEIITLRNTIRRHRDQKGDNRCWIDDYWLYELIPGNKELLNNNMSREEGMKKCTNYYNHRSIKKVYEKKNTHESYNDKDLEKMSDKQLLIELKRLRKAIINHRDIKGREKTLSDDKELYFVLPEKIQADFRLPKKEEMLGTAKEGIGCPNFWKSHETCKKEEHNLHQWGPCIA